MVKIRISSFGHWKSTHHHILYGLLSDWLLYVRKLLLFMLLDPVALLCLTILWTCSTVVTVVSLHAFTTVARLVFFRIVFNVVKKCADWLPTWSVNLSYNVVWLVVRININFVNQIVNLINNFPIISISEYTLIVNPARINIRHSFHLKILVYERQRTRQFRHALGCEDQLLFQGWRILFFWHQVQGWYLWLVFHFQRLDKFLHVMSRHWHGVWIGIVVGVFKISFDLLEVHGTAFFLDVGETACGIRGTHIFVIAFVHGCGKLLMKVVDHLSTSNAWKHMYYFLNVMLSNHRWLKTGFDPTNKSVKNIFRFLT